MKVGLVMPIGEEDAGAHPYAEIRRLALAAEEGGLDSLWVADHLLFRFEDEPTRGIWESWTVLAALAEATSRVELGTIVLATPFRNPAVLAKMAATLDEVSGGRLILGIGAGWHEPEFQAFGIPFDHLASRFEEAVSIIVPLLRDGRADVHGRFHAAADAELRPRGPRPDGIPILIAGRRPRMLGIAARHADAWNAAWFGRPALFLERRDALFEACREAGRDPATIEVTVGIRVAGSGEEAIDEQRVLPPDAESVADALDEYAQLGVGHVIVSLDEPSDASLSALVDGTARYRGAGAA